MSDTDFHNRDYSEEFSITLEWHEWNKLFSLMGQGMDKKESEDWPEEEYERDRELRKRFSRKISESSPGNGMDDWPDSMKKAWDETVTEMFQEMRGGDSE